MFDGLYRRRLEDDLPEWRKKGWVTAQGETEILASVGKKPSKARLPMLIGFLGAILIAASAMTFVAANWEEIPRIWKLLLLLTVMAISYLAAWRLNRNSYTGFGDAALLIGTGVYGGAIMLVGQIYHIGNHFPDGILIWAIGALAAAILAASRSALVIGLAGAVYWSAMEMIEFNWIIHWPFLIFWVVFAALVVLWRWGAGYRLIILAFMAWLAIALANYANEADWNALNFLAVVMMFMAAVFAGSHLVSFTTPEADKVDKWLGFGLSARPWAITILLLFAAGMRLFVTAESHGPLEGSDWTIWLIIVMVLAITAGAAFVYAIAQNKLRPLDAAAVIGIAALPLVFAIVANGETDLDDSLIAGIVASVTAIGFSIWAMEYGQETNYPKAINLGLMAFGLVVLDIYYATFGTLIDTAIFFLLGGVLLLALAWFLNRLRKRFIEPEAETKA